MLFLELALIRWLGANIVHLSYFSNFVLLGSFLGVGLGFLRAAAPGAGERPMPAYSLAALLGLIGFVSAYPVTVNRDSTQLLFFTNVSTSGPSLGLVLPAVFLAVAVVMAGPGEVVGRCFRQLPRLEAYRLDLVGSLLGIVSFTVLSFVGAPPLAWFGTASAVFVVLLGRPTAAIGVTLLVAITLLLGYPLRHDKNVLWSPYYKVATTPTPDGAGGTAWSISVNGIPHQRLTSAAVRTTQEPWYLQTYRQIPRVPRNVLIVGAGTGTDVALALQKGAEHVDAVEIDPTLLRLGREHNPDHVYSDPRVSAHVDDGRAFLDRTKRRYDLIVFALPDSLTLVSGASSLRLESYLFTEQAVSAARSHLATGGAFSMYNYYRQRWLVDRLAGTLDDVFGHPPCVYELPQASDLAVLTVGRNAADQTCTQSWVRPATTPAPASDDKPFLYLKDSSIPSLYATALLLIVLGSALAVGVVLVANAAGAGRDTVRVLRGQARSMWSYRDLFLLGAAFLLVETKSVTGFALLFGTTWLVNALVFAGVLLAVLAAVEVTQRMRTAPLGIMYPALLAALALNWIVPVSWLLSLGVPLRAAAAITISFLPVFIANIIFAKRFADTADAPLAFGTNLLGAIAGGCLEYLSLVTGYRMLLIVAAVLYTCAYLTRPRTRQRASSGVSEVSLVQVSD
jgi:SAM-dependent methyltransferase